MAGGSDQPSLQALLDELNDLRQGKQHAEARAVILHQAAAYLLGDVRAVIPEVNEKAAGDLEAAILRYTERTE